MQSPNTFLSPQILKSTTKPKPLPQKTKPAKPKLDYPKFHRLFPAFSLALLALGLATAIALVSYNQDIRRTATPPDQITAPPAAPTTNPKDFFLPIILSLSFTLVLTALVILGYTQKHKP